MKYFFLANIVKKKLLREVSKPHKGRYIPLASSKRVGFIFDASEPDVDEGISVLVKALKSKGIVYKAAYVDFRKKELRKPVVSASEPLVLLCRKNRKWNGLPSDSVFNAFVSEPFDIIIDFTQSKRVTPLEYLFAAAESALRIGVYPNKFLNYDMTITKEKEIGSKAEDVSVKELAANIVNYLTFIHS